jgi:hypothetical protein
MSRSAIAPTIPHMKWTPGPYFQAGIVPLRTW